MTSPSQAVARPYGRPRGSFLLLGSTTLVALSLPVLVTEGRVGLPQFEDPGIDLAIVSYLTYVAVALALAVLTALSISGRRIHDGLLLALALLPGAVPLVHAAFQIARAVPGEDAPLAGVLLRLSTESVLASTSFGFAASGCALLTTSAMLLLDLRAALRREGLHLYRKPGAQSGRVIAQAVALGAVGLLAVRIHAEHTLSRRLALAMAIAMAAVAGGGLAIDTEPMARAEPRAQRRLRGRSSLVAVSAAAAVVCIEISFWTWAIRPFQHDNPIAEGMQAWAPFAPWLCGVAVLSVVLSPLWRFRSAIASGAKVSAALGCAAGALIFAGLVWFEGTVIHIRDVLVATPSESTKLPLVVTHGKVDVHAGALPGQLVFEPEIDIFNPTPSAMRLWLVEGRLIFSPDEVSEGASLGLKLALPPGEHTRVPLFSIDLLRQEALQTQLSGDFRIECTLHVDWPGGGFGGEISLAIPGKLDTATARAILGGRRGVDSASAPSASP